jgi:hypothetical protein
MSKILWNDRRIDVRPCSYIDSCYVVGRTAQSAPRTHELIPTRSVASFIDSALWTDVGGPSWIDQEHWNTSQDCFVFDEIPQLPESPRIMLSALSLSYSGLVSDSCQVFEGDSSTSVFGFRHDSLGDYVVDVGCESSFFSRESIQMSLGTSGTATLEITPEFCMLGTNGIDLLACMGFPITISSDVDDSKVNPKSTGGFDSFRFGNIVYSLTGYSTDLVGAAVLGGVLLVVGGFLAVHWMKK